MRKIIEQARDVRSLDPGDYAMVSPRMARAILDHLMDKSRLCREGEFTFAPPYLMSREYGSPDIRVEHDEPLAV